LVGATVTWKIPLSSTMLTFSEEEIKENNFSYSITEKYNIFSKEILAKYDDNGNIIYTEDNKPEVDINTLHFPYHIKDYYNNGFSNNTIMCEVKLMDEEILETSISFNFATGEVNGTSYAFVVSPMTDTICTSSKEENSKLLYTPLYLKIELYNEENNQINIPLKNIDPKWICCETNTLEVSGYTFDTDINYYISNTQYIESNYSLSFIVDDNTIENPNVIGCRIIPLKSYGGPAIIQFEIKSINISDNTYNFTTYYAVPWCPYGESLYIEGGNTIVYDSFGTNAKYYNEKYKLRYAKNGVDNNKEYEKDDEVQNISWKMRYYTYNNTHYDGNYSYVDCENDKDIPSEKIKEEYKLLLSYMPKLKDNKLYVSPMYLDGLLESKDYNLYPAVIAYNEKN
jgi:hypothetical protein